MEADKLVLGSAEAQGRDCLDLCHNSTDRVVDSGHIFEAW